MPDIFERAARNLVSAVTDPEMPMLTLADLGVVRDVTVEEGGTVTVTITPTYSACPAMATMRDDIRQKLARYGFTDVDIRTRLDPAWSSDWISDRGRARLVAHGYSVPDHAPWRAPGPIPLSLVPRPRIVACPLCGSVNTQLVSEFGSTLCKAHYQCQSCWEPFDHVKEI